MSEQAPETASEETVPEVTEGNPAETAWAKTAERSAEPATGAQPMSDEELVASLDRAIDRHEEIDKARDGIEDESEAEPDDTTIVSTALDLGVSLNDAPPDRFQGIDLGDKNAVRSRLIEIRAERKESDAAAEQAEALQAARAYSENQQVARQAVSEIALEQARSILDEGDPTRSWQAASIVQESHPEIFDAFMREWTADDPQTAGVWASTHPPLDHEAYAEEQEDLLFEAEQETERLEREEEQRAISQSYVERVKELEADPTARRYVNPALHIIAMQLESGIAPDARTPAEAKAFIDASVRTARELARTHEEADEVARLLAPIDERVELDAALEVEEQTGVFPDLSDREELLEQTRGELISQWGLRGPKRSTEEDNEAFAAEIFGAIRENHPSVWEAGEPTTPEQDAARIEEREERLEARRRQLNPRLLPRAR